MNMSKVAVQLYTLREYCQNEKDFEETLKRIKAIGYTAVQMSGVRVSHEKVAELCKKYGITVCATHYSIDTLENEFDKSISDHEVIDCKYIGLGSLSPSPWQDGFDGKTAYDLFIPRANKVGKKLKEAGYVLVYHNHNFEFESFNGMTAFEKLYTELDPSIHMEVDVYWVQAGGANPVDIINHVSGRIDVVHLKDMCIKDGAQHFAPIGSGNLNWPAIIDACEKAGTKWYAIEQDDCFGEDPFECLTKSYNYLKAL